MKVRGRRERVAEGLESQAFTRKSGWVRRNAYNADVRKAQQNECKMNAVNST